MQAPAPPVTQPHPRPTTGRRKPPSALQPSSKQAPEIAPHTVFTIKFPAPRVKRQPATKRPPPRAAVILSLPTAGRRSEESIPPPPLMVRPAHHERSPTSHPAFPLPLGEGQGEGSRPRHRAGSFTTPVASRECRGGFQTRPYLSIGDVLPVDKHVTIYNC